MNLDSQLICQRHLFDIPNDIHYFNTAYNAPQLRAAENAIADEIAKKNHPWKRTADDFFANADTVRELAASALGGSADGYAIVPSASYGIATAARALSRHIANEDEILVLSEEFPSNYYVWKKIADEREARLQTVARPGDGDWTNALLNAIGERTKIVAAPQCHWTDGARIDLVAISKACDKVGAALVIDATQSLGVCALDLEALRAAFVVAAGYKWLLFPYGIGLLYVDKKWRTSAPLEETWLARSGSNQFENLTRYVNDYAPGARRFDVGETCTAGLAGAIVALRQLDEWRVPRIEHSVRAITVDIRRKLEALEFEFPDGAFSSPHMLGCTRPNTDMGMLAQELRKKGVFVSRRGETLRIAPHLHVNETDVDGLIAAVKSILNDRSGAAQRAN